MERSGFHKWSLCWREKYFKFAGYVARLPSDRIASQCLSYRDLSWWRAEQAKPTGVRHEGRFKPWRWETVVFQSVTSWRDLAQCRDAWRVHVEKMSGVTRTFKIDARAHATG